MENKDYRFIKKSQRRLMGLQIAMGGPIYADDMAPKDCLIIKLLHSPYPFAEVLSIDTAAAKRIPGVVGVYTYDDVYPDSIHSGGSGEFPLCDRELITKYPRYEGDVIALVAAETEDAANMAIRLMKPKYAVQEPVMDAHKSLGSDILVHGDHLDEIHKPGGAGGYDAGGYDAAKNQVKDIEYKYGDFEAAYAASANHAEITTYTGRQAHAMLETHRSYCYIDGNGRYVVVGPFQTAFPSQFTIARAAGLQVHEVHIIKSQVGGAFGGKNLLIPERYVAFVTHKTQRPSKLVLTRKECFGATGTRHAVEITTKIGFDDDGCVKALYTDWITDAGAYGEVTDEIMFTGVHNILPLYPRIKNFYVHQSGVYTNKITGCAFRGFGAPQASFNFNQLMAIAADKIGMDITEFHLENIGVVGDSHPLMNGYSDSKPVYLTSTGLKECIINGRKAIDWYNKKDRKPDDRYYYGVGMAVAAHGSGVAGVDRGNAAIRVNLNGTFTIFSGHCDIGTGSDTVISQIAAETLNVPVNRVIMIAGNSEITPNDAGTFGSSNIYVNGNTVKRAAEKLLDMMKEQARKFAGLSDDAELTFDEEGFHTADGCLLMSFRQFCSRINESVGGVGSIEASASFGCEISPSPFVATYVSVRIDRMTGKILLDECINAVDCGSVMHPNNAMVQINGGSVQSIGQALFEDYRYSSSGHLASKCYQEYKIPCQMDIPRMEVMFAENYEPTGPYGAKSIGEIATNAPGPAIANAIFNATGYIANELPITPEKMLRVIELKEKGACKF